MTWKPTGHHPRIRELEQWLYDLGFLEEHQNARTMSLQEFSAKIEEAHQMQQDANDVRKALSPRRSS